jgi:hypothetical protein
VIWKPVGHPDRAGRLKLVGCSTGRAYGEAGRGHFTGVRIYLHVRNATAVHDRLVSEAGDVMMVRSRIR